MKQDITRKAVKEMFGDKIVEIRFCCAHALLRDYVAKFVWYSNTYGWYCDVYIVDGIAVTTGYNPFGREIDYKKLGVLEMQARDAISNNDKNKLNQLNTEFVKLIHETVKGE